VRGDTSTFKCETCTVKEEKALGADERKL